MEGVGARLGRSSSRYGTTTVFTGPVRKWKKDWVPITPSNNTTNNNSNHNHNHNHHHHHHHNQINSSSSSSLVNGASLNGNNGTVSHLRLYKWTPVSQSSNNKHNSSSNSNHNNINGINGDISPTKDSNKDDTVSEEPPRRKFKYIPVAVLEEQNEEAEDNTDDEVKIADDDENTAEQTSKSDGHDEKPDINDMPMDENQDSEENETAAPGRQDLNESLDLSLGLTSHEEELDSNTKTGLTKEVKQDRLKSGTSKA